MNCSVPGFPVLHYLLEFTQAHVHWVSDAIQPSHPLLPPSPLALSLPEHQGLFQWVGSSHQVAKVWSFSFSISPSNEFQDWFPLGLTGLISLMSKGLSRVFFSITAFKSIISLMLSLLYGPDLASIHDYWKNYSFDYMEVLGSKLRLNDHIKTTEPHLILFLSLHTYTSFCFLNMHFLIGFLFLCAGSKISQEPSY